LLWDGTDKYVPGKMITAVCDVKGGVYSNSKKIMLLLKFQFCMLYTNF